jgi:hypothetical protein
VGCAPAPLASTGELGRDELSVALFDFEDMLATKFPFAQGSKSWIGRVLEKISPVLVVLSPDGIRNRELKDQLVASGYTKVLVVSGHHIYRREPPAAAPAPAPAPAPASASAPTAAPVPAPAAEAAGR